LAHNPHALVKIIKGANEMLETRFRIMVEVEGVTLVCFLEHEPEELNHGEAPDFPACMNLVNAYCGDIDIAHLLMQSIVDHICEEALVMFNSESTT
jgi:hypothetical protein